MTQIDPALADIIIKILLLTKRVENLEKILQKDCMKFSQQMSDEEHSSCLEDAIGPHGQG